MFILYLNPMTGKAEDCRPVARAETREALLAYVESERVEPYKDEDRWHKVFRKGGPLEWFNAPDGSNVFYEEIVDVGTLEDWKIRAEREWNNMCANLRMV